MNKYYINFIISILSCFLYSCNKDKAKWDETDNGVKIYHNNDNSLISSTSIKWDGDTTFYGLAHGEGVFSFQDKYHKDKNFSKKIEAIYGSMEEMLPKESFVIGDRNDKGLLNGFGVVKNNRYTFIGKAKNGEFKDEGVVLINDKLYYRGNLKKSEPQGEGNAFYPSGELLYKGDWKKGLPDGKGTIYFIDGTPHYSGKWKKGKYNKDGILYYNNGLIHYSGGWKEGAYNGKGCLYYPNGNLFYNGKWKDNQFNGYGTLYLPFDTISHVWKNGNLDKGTEKYYETLYYYESRFSPEYFKKIIKRAVVWEKYYDWLYITIWVSALLIILCFVILTEFVIKQDPYSKPKRWNVAIPYLSLLVQGCFGMHRSLLRSRLAYVYLCCFGVIVALETRGICHYLFWPSTWFMWKVSIISMVSVGIIAIFLIFDLFWIPWRVYVLNRKYYMTDRYEKEIKENLSVPLIETCEDLPGLVDKAVIKFPKYLKEVKRIHSKEYEGSTGWLARAGRALIGSTKAVDFEYDKLVHLEKVRGNALNLYNEFALTSCELNLYMEQSRITALKNLTLAKEMVLKIGEYRNKNKKINHEHQELIKDIKLDDRMIAPMINTSEFINWDVEVHWDIVVVKSLHNIQNVMNAGLGIRGTAIGVGVSLASSLVEGISNAMKREANARLQVNISGNNIIKQIDLLCDSIIKNESKILNCGEILEALYNANKAFVEAYSPLRDQVFGEKPNIKDFFVRDRALKKYANDKAFFRDLHYLIQVCQEYNKINKSK